MNNLYQWHDEWMSELEMRQVRQEMAHVRMLKEAGIIGNGWPVRAGRAFVNILASGLRKIRSFRSVERPSRQPDGKKYA